MADPKKVTSEERMLSTSEVAQREGVSQRTIRRKCENGEIPAYKLGRQWRIFSHYREHLYGTQQSRGSGRCAA